MPRSMTGYGAAEGSVNSGRLHVEIRTVNHRHFSTAIKLCSPLQALESELRTRVRTHLARGQVTLTSRWIEEPERDAVTSVNLGRAREVVQALTDLKEALKLPGEIDLGFVARQPDIFTVIQGSENALDTKQVWEIVDAAVAQVVTTRDREGEALTTVLLDLLTELKNQLQSIETRAPQRLEVERDRLRRSVSELLDGRKLDDDRLHQEIAFIADKLDITEEIVRLGTHLSACREVMGKDGPVGRELAFLGQEMLREVNTIGSKANDAVIGQTVIAMKGVIEQFREQVENLE